MLLFSPPSPLECTVRQRLLVPVQLKLSIAVISLLSHQKFAAEVVELKKHQFMLRYSLSYNTENQIIL